VRLHHATHDVEQLPLPRFGIDSRGRVLGVGHAH
jgi:hypothetical protein